MHGCYRISRALIEGAIAEKRAEMRARVKLIDTSASQIAEQMQTSPEYARAAVTNVDETGFGFSLRFDSVNWR